MEINVKLNLIDHDAVELWNNNWLVGIVHIDHFERNIVNRLLKKEELEMRIVEV